MKIDFVAGIELLMDGIANTMWVIKMNNKIDQILDISSLFSFNGNPFYGFFVLFRENEITENFNY